MTASRIGLGAAPWGTTTDEDDAAELLLEFVDAGGDLVDTADNYGRGRSEEMLGRLLDKVVPRSSVVIATKAGAIPGKSAFRHDASRQHLLQALDDSLQRLATDYVDVWQVHVWDHGTPLAETLDALEAAVASGRARCAGVSNYSGWQLAKAASKAGHNPAALASCQVEYSLLERGIERELVPAALDAEVSVLAWGPLGRGVLTGKYASGVPADRAANWFFNWYVRPRLEDEKAPSIVENVVSVANDIGASPQAVALAWVRDRPAVSAMIVGARTSGQLREALEAESLDLPDHGRRRLDDCSAPYVGYPERPLHAL